jgi:hypothetical protein
MCFRHKEPADWLEQLLERAYREGLESADWQRNTYQSPDVRAAWDRGRQERDRKRQSKE